MDLVIAHVVCIHDIRPNDPRRSLMSLKGQTQVGDGAAVEYGTEPRRASMPDIRLRCNAYSTVRRDIGHRTSRSNERVCLLKGGV